jgi:hypothetical protein
MILFESSTKIIPLSCLAIVTLRGGGCADGVRVVVRAWHICRGFFWDAVGGAIYLSIYLTLNNHPIDLGAVL